MQKKITSRRTFIKQSILLSCSVFMPSEVFAKQAHIILKQEDRNFLRAIIPVLIKGVVLNSKQIDDIVLSVDASINHMPLATQDELTQLFWLMRQRFFRIILAGIWQDWQNAKPEHIQRLLENWQSDKLGILDVAYIALHDLCLGAWYANPQSWQAINYPGPPKL